MAFQCPSGAAHTLRRKKMTMKRQVMAQHLQQCVQRRPSLRVLPTVKAID